MSATIIPFRPEVDRDALIRQAQAIYESSFPTTPLIDDLPEDGGKARIQRRRQTIGLEHLFHGSSVGGDRDLTMDHADNGLPCDVAYCAPDDDCA
jgi:hypothetical protein